MWVSSILTLVFDLFCLQCRSAVEFQVSERNMHARATPPPRPPLPPPPTAHKGGAMLGSALAWSGPARLVAVNHKRAHNSSIKLDATKSTVSWTPIHLPLLHPLSALPPSGHALEAATLSVHRRMTCGPPLPPATQFQHPSRRAH